MHIQTFVPQRAVEGFDEGVIGRFSGSAEVDARAVMVSPHFLSGALGRIDDASAKR